MVWEKNQDLDVKASYMLSIEEKRKNVKNALT